VENSGRRPTALKLTVGGPLHRQGKFSFLVLQRPLFTKQLSLRLLGLGQFGFPFFQERIGRCEGFIPLSKIQSCCAFGFRCFQRHDLTPLVLDPS
jgi:hypothetical protein